MDSATGYTTSLAYLRFAHTRRKARFHKREEKAFVGFGVCESGRDCLAPRGDHRKAGRAGGGTTLTGTTFVQRLNTVQGLAPATGCDLPKDIGSKAFMPDTADYFFYTKD